MRFSTARLRVVFVATSLAMAIGTLGCDRGGPRGVPTPAAAGPLSVADAAAELERRGYALTYRQIEGKAHVVAIAMTDSQVEHVPPGQRLTIGSRDLEHMTQQPWLTTLHLKKAALHDVNEATLLS